MDALALSQTTGAVFTANGAESAAPSVGADQHAVVEIAGADLLLVLVTTLGTMFILFLLWRIVRLPVTQGRIATYYFWCPASRRLVRAEFQLDPTKSQPLDVNWCSAFQPAAIVRCRKHCVREPYAAVFSQRAMTGARP